MRFLRFKPRRIEAVRSGNVNEEEDEEGREKLLPALSAHKNEQSSAMERNSSAANHASRTMLLTSPPVPACSIALSSIGKQFEQAALCTSQMVVVNAPLHCQGCARRVKKTLAKLPGVHTYHVDMEQQKVTVIGNVCPDRVLQSVNKVIKGAQLWVAPSKPPTSSQPLS